MHLNPFNPLDPLSNFAHLFVYGTLKDPAQVAAVVGAAVPVRVLGAGRVCGVLFDVGDYPALRPSDAADDIVPGVVLEVDEAAFARLDAYEGVSDGLYVRERCTVQMDDGRVSAAWVYIYNRPTHRLRRIAAWPPPRG